MSDAPEQDGPGLDAGPWAKDPRTLDELIAAALAEPDSEDSRRAVTILTYRGTRAELDAATALTNSPRPAERSVGAAILGQLGWDRQTFLRESVAALLPMLDDPDAGVVASAASALGHRGDVGAIERVATLRAHTSDDVRQAVAFALGGLDDGRAYAALVELTRDACGAVRDWAAFGLRTAAEAGRGDTPATRDALAAAAADPDAEVRGEALLGLASLGDPRALPLLREELGRPPENDLVIEAAEKLADPSLAPLLRQAWKHMHLDTRSWFDSHGFLRAYAACGGQLEDLSAA